MSRTSFVSRLRDQVIRPLVHSALAEDEIPEIDVAVVTGTEFDNPLREPWGQRWTYPDDGHEHVWIYVTYRPTNERCGWRLGRSEDLYDPSALIDALFQFGWYFEGWVSETTFAWGQQRRARRVKLGDLPEWLITGA